MMLRKIFSVLSNKKILNNVVFNNFLYWIGLDAKFKNYIHPYHDFKPSEELSLQEIAGYSNRPEINEVLAQLHAKLKEVSDAHLSKGSRVLDVGCGPGLYLKDFNDSLELSGIDISKVMVDIARKEVPAATIIDDDFLKHDWNGQQFDLIYSIGVLIYMNKSELKPFLNKIEQLLAPGGIFMLSYPHALRKMDLYYPELTYVLYSPMYLEKLTKKNFKILHHKHIIDDRKVEDYDLSPYQNQENAAWRTYRNTSVLILKKNG